MIMEYGIIAQVNLGDAPPDHFKWTILIIVGVVLVGLQIYIALRKTVPNPLQVEKLDKFATRDFCEALQAENRRRLDGHDADVRALYEEIKRDRQQNQEHASQRSAAIYRKIDEVQREVSSKIDGLNEQMTTGFKDVERAVGRIEGQINKP